MLGGAQRGDGRDQLLARRAGAGGRGVRRALQRGRAADARVDGGRRAGTRSARRSAPPAPAGRTRRWRRAARRAFGPAVDPLFYDEPIEVASAEGVWITDTAGRRYLDAYNNVPCVGHGHPRVTAAIARQSRAHQHPHALPAPGAIELAERLAATCPPELDTVLLVNSGSEANDLAWRMATAVTGQRGGLCTAFAYHGITEATAALSPGGLVRRARARARRDVGAARRLPRAESRRRAFATALDRMRDRGLRRRPRSSTASSPATASPTSTRPTCRSSCGSPMTPAGCGSPTRSRPATAAPATRCGASQRFGVVPDFVTLGKPMGNGHPVAAVITRSDIVAAARRPTPRCSAPSAATR